MKNFVKEMDRKGSGFNFLQEKFPLINMEKLQTGIFDGLQIRELMKEPMLDETLREAELSTGQSLKSVVTNHWSAEYEKEIEELQKSFCKLGARMSVKVHFRLSHTDYFQKQWGY